MTGRLPKQLRRRNAAHAQFLAEMNSGRPLVDNAGHLTVIGELEYDGPRCPDCGDPAETDNAVCADCAPCPCCRAGNHPKGENI